MWAAPLARGVTLRRLTRCCCPGQDRSTSARAVPSACAAGRLDLIGACARGTITVLSVAPDRNALTHPVQRKRCSDVGHDR